MKTIYRGVLLTLGCVSLSACATVVRGPSTDWHVATSPPGAAVRTSDGLTCSPTPCTLHVSRKAKFTATITKPGYNPETVYVSHDVTLGGGIAFAGNLVLGGLIGMTVDYVTGSAEDPYPRQLDLNLKNQGPAFGAPLAYVPPPVTAVSYDVASYPPASYPPASYAPRSYRSSEVNPSAAQAVDSRIVYMKVLPDHSVQEVREPGQ